MVHTWANGYVKYKEHNVESVPIYLSGSEATGKSHLVKSIYNGIWKTLFYDREGSEKSKFLLLGPRKISAVSIGGPIIYSGLAGMHLGYSEGSGPNFEKGANI